MKLSLCVFVLAAAALPCIACGSNGQDPADGDPTSEDALTKSHTLKCTVDTPRLGQYDDQHYQSFELTLKGSTAKIDKIVYTPAYVQQMQQEVANEQSYLDKGLEYDGKTPLTADDRAQGTDLIDQVGKILAAGTNGSLGFEGKIKPYVRQPKKPTVQYPLDMNADGIKADVLWDTLGNEGWGARLLLPPEMSTGAAGKPDIEGEGSQGPMWDRYDCK